MNNDFDGEELGFWDRHAKDSAASLSQPVYSVQEKRDVPIVMSDGTRLYCDIYTPDTAEGGTRFPVLLGYSPFGKEAQYVGRLRDPIKLGNLMYEQGIEVGGIDYFVSRGYIVVVANPRGILNSEGCWTGILSEQDQNDCCDIIRWAGHYLSDGNVGMIGSGYAGQIQPLVASLSPQYLKAIMPIDVMDDMYLNCYPGGIVSDINYPLCSYIPVINSISEAELYNTEEKLKMMLAEAKRDPELASNSYYYRGLDSFPPRHYTWNIDILLNPLKNSFWAKRSFGDRQVTIPSYLVALYYEYGESTISAFDIYNKIASDVPKKLMVIDPAVDKTSPYDKANPEILRWYDHWLKGIDTGIMDEPPIKLLMMGEDRYRYDTDWPSKHTVYTNFYLGPENTLSVDKCSGGEASPANLRHIPPTKQSQMPQDVPVLSYSTAPFAADTEISGPLSVKLYAAIDGSEAHFSVRLWDKDTTGRRQLLSTGHLKASHGKQGPEETLPYRVTNEHLNPTPVQPDKIYEYHFELAPIGNIFKAGHTLELEIKTMDQQYFDYMEVASLPRLYTSGRVAGPHPLASEVNISVFTGGNHASCVILPMVNGPTDWVK